MPLDLDPTTLVRLAAIAHLLSLAAIIYAPIHLGWHEALERVSPLLRQMGQVYHYYTTGTIIAMGVVSLFCAPDLISGTPLARSVCGFIALFWIARLGVAIFYDSKPHLSNAWLKLSYHALSVLFVAFGFLYGWLALR
ncbi:hypothetical protein [Oleiharenicola lentus]|uniref:hypothetical protein n=1 Tax=Oleiharenicola lentus TaxID=2508720 RepID=UPI003F67D6D5